MKNRTVLVGIAILLSIAVVAQKTNSNIKTFESQTGLMKLTYNSWAAKQLEDGRIKFVAKGTPVRAIWGARNTTIECTELSGFASREGKKDLEISTADMKGKVVMTSTAPSSQKVSSQSQTVILTADSADFVASTGTVNLIGEVTIVNKDPGAKRSMTLTGNAGTVVLSPDMKEPDKAVKSAILKGPVNFTINGTREVKDVKTGAKKLVDVVITGQANQLSYLADGRKLSLTGNVKIDSDDPLLSGSMEDLSDATIWFNEKFDPINVEMNGNPGSSSIKPKKGSKD